MYQVQMFVESFVEVLDLLCSSIRLHKPTRLLLILQYNAILIHLLTFYSTVVLICYLI